MRRLILEASEKELIKVGIEIPQFTKIKSLEFLFFLRQDHEEFSAISEVVFKDETGTVKDLLGGGFLIEAQLLEKKTDRMCVVFIRGGPTLSSVLEFIGVPGGYLFTPLGINEEKIKICFLGNETQVKEFMERLDILQIRYRVVLLTDANFSPISPLSQLTEKQRQVLMSAYKMGYYAVPRNVTTEEIAKKLNLVDSTVVEHLRKAEQKLISQILEQ